MVLMRGFFNLFKELAEFRQKNRDRDVQLQQIKMQHVWGKSSWGKP